MLESITETVPEMLSDLISLLKVVGAAVLAGALGWERDLRRRPAGMRTHMLVGSSACLFVILGEMFIFKFAGAAEAMRFDPLRVIEAVVAGVSFLGAGTIFVSHGRHRVQGLTTAASLLAATGIGMAVALERYVLAGSFTVVLLLVLAALREVTPSTRDEGKGPDDANGD